MTASTSANVCSISAAGALQAATASLILEHACGFPTTFACTEAQVGAEIAQIAANVSHILTELRNVAPKAQIVILGLYNAYPSVLQPEGTGDKLVAAFNAAQANGAAKAHRARFANPEPLFNPSLITGKPETSDLTTICAFTAMCPGGTFNVAGDFHPSKPGSAVLAGVVGSAFRHSLATQADERRRPCAPPAHPLAERASAAR